MHWHVFSKDLVGIHVWRQTQTQTVTDNFYQEDMNIFRPKINELRTEDRIMRMEFPVMQWIFAVFHKVLGSNVAISRVLTFILGLFSAWGIFYLCDVIFKNKGLAALGAWTFSFSPVFFYYTVNPLPDNFALCCSIWSVGFFFRYTKTQKISQLVLSALMLCLASLAKLPFIVYGIIVPVYLLIAVRRGNMDFGKSVMGAALYLLLMIPALAWYIAVIPTWEGNGVVAGVLENSSGFSEILDIAVHHLISALPELLLNYGSVLFFVAGFYFLFKRGKQRHQYFPLLVSWSIGVLIYFAFEINMIAKVHDYYLFPFLPLIFLIVAYGCWQLVQTRGWLKYISFVMLAVLPVTAYLRVNGRWNTEKPGFNAAYYHYKKDIQNLLPKNAIVVAGNDESHFILLYYLDRTGWAFDNDRLDEGLLTYYTSKGAGYLFVDSDVDRKEEIKRRLGEKIFEKETLRVYKLK